MSCGQGIEIGSGFGGSRMLGSEHNDEFYMEDGHVRTRTNRCVHRPSLFFSCRVVLRACLHHVLLYMCITQCESILSCIPETTETNKNRCCT